MRSIFWFCLLFLLGGNPLFAGSPVMLERDTYKVDLTGKFSILKDDDGILTIKDVVNKDFTPIPNYLAAGYTDAAHWIKFTVEPRKNAPAEWYLEVDMPYLDFVDLYFYKKDGWLYTHKTGDNLPFSYRDVKYRNFVFRVQLDPGKSTNVYLRVKTGSTTVVKAKLWQPQTFSEASSSENVFLGLLFGCFLILTVSSIVQYLATKDIFYGYYSIYIIATQLVYLGTTGYSAWFMFPDYPVLTSNLMGISVCWSIGFGTLFTAKILELERKLPLVNKIYLIFGIVSILMSLSVLFGKYGYAANVVNAIIIIVSVSSFVIALFYASRGDVVAASYLVAFTLYIVSTVFVAIQVLGLATPSSIIHLLQPIGNALHMVFISIGLSLRIKLIEREKSEAQAMLLQAAQYIERELESQVEQRTQELAQEISERKMIEQRLRESEGNLRSILEAAPFPMLVSRFDDGTILFINNPALELFGLSSEYCIGHKTIDFYDEPEEREKILETIREKGVLVGYELMMRRANDEKRWVMISAVRFNYRGYDAIISCTNDISIRKYMETKLRDAHERAEAALTVERRALKEQRNFLAMISHEFRTPLAIVEGAAQLISLYFPEDEDTNQELGKIHRAVSRLGNLIETCLADDWINSTAMSIKPVPLNLSQLAQEICEEKRNLNGKGRLSFLGPESLPLVGDDTLLKVVVSNLIDNALKYSPANSGVDVKLRQDNNTAIIEVFDKGPGISLEEQEFIFDKFYRSTRTDKVSGAGLGLYIVKRIVTLHNGEVELESYPNQGSIFRVSIPVI